MHLAKCQQQGLAGVLSPERMCADCPSRSAQYHLVLPDFLAKCVGVLEVGRYLVVSWCHISSCFYCLNFVPNAYMNVALSWKMHLTWSLISALFSQLGSLLLDGNASFSCTAEEPGANQTLAFSKIIPVPVPLAHLMRYLPSVLSHPLLLPGTTTQERKIAGTGLLFNGHHQKWSHRGVWEQKCPHEALTATLHNTTVISWV